MDYSYWQKQSVDKPLFPDIEWSKPEQKSKAGRLAIIGGNRLGFASVAESYATALQTGAGEVKILLPDVLKKTIPSTMNDVIFGQTNPSGSLAREALIDMKAIADWSTGVLLIGDAGKNSETTILYESFIKDYYGPLTITRDSIDLMLNSISEIIERPNTAIVASFAQIQKIFQKCYYPIVLTFSMQLINLVEALHKFTITYPVCVSVFHNEHLVIAFNGQIVTQEWKNPMEIWKGITATKSSVYWMWNQLKPLESFASSLQS